MQIRPLRSEINSEQRGLSTPPFWSLAFPGLYPILESKASSSHRDPPATCSLRSDSGAPRWLPRLSNAACGSTQKCAPALQLAAGCECLRPMLLKFFDSSALPLLQPGRHSVRLFVLRKHSANRIAIVDLAEHSLNAPDSFQGRVQRSSVHRREQFQRIAELFRDDPELMQLARRSLCFDGFITTFKKLLRHAGEHPLGRPCDGSLA